MHFELICVKDVRSILFWICLQLLISLLALLSLYLIIFGTLYLENILKEKQVSLVNSLSLWFFKIVLISMFVDFPHCFCYWFLVSIVFRKETMISVFLSLLSGLTYGVSWRMFHVHLKNVISAVVGWDILYMSIRSGGFSVFRSSVSLELGCWMSKDCGTACFSLQLSMLALFSSSGVWCPYVCNCYNLGEWTFFINE